jgi:hypothetical protein
LLRLMLRKLVLPLHHSQAETASSIPPTSTPIGKPKVAFLCCLARLQRTHSHTTQPASRRWSLLRLQARDQTAKTSTHHDERRSGASGKDVLYLLVCSSAAQCTGCHDHGESPNARVDDDNDPNNHYRSVHVKHSLPLLVHLSSWSLTPPIT